MNDRDIDVENSRNERRRNKKRWQYRDAALAAGAGSIFIGAVVAGYLIGSWLDRTFHWEGIGVAIGILLGFLGGAWEVVTTLTKLGRK